MNGIKVLDYYGNEAILDLPKTAFLCSRNIPASTVLKCYDWAIEQRDKGNCIISGFQSKIEKDVLHYLLQGTQPIIIALARGIMNRIEPELREAILNKRLLLASHFTKSVKRPNIKTAEKRNRMMVEMADEVVFGFIKEGGSLLKLKIEYENSKRITIL